jgi:hypothetical protein
VVGGWHLTRTRLESSLLGRVGSSACGALGNLALIDGIEGIENREPRSIRVEVAFYSEAS